jgi:hypothetical protein
VGLDLGQRQGHFFGHNALSGATVHFASCAVGARGLFLMDKPLEHEADHEPLCRAKVIYTHTHTHTIHF